MAKSYTPAGVLVVVLREMQALGTMWRMDWSDFDGRTLRSQLDEIAAWAAKAVTGVECEEFDVYSQQLQEAT